jgi:hypothetical protein
MGFDLTNDRGTYLRFSPSGWALALTIGERYGWQREGTTMSNPEAAADWSGEYATNEGQRVSATDARSLADACARALDDPDYEKRTSDIWNQLDAEVAQHFPGRATTRPMGPDDLKKFRGRLQELIAFCREGSFIIE